MKRKYTAREKDDILCRFYNGNVGDCTPIIEIIEILVSDGYVRFYSSAVGCAYLITDKGKGFFLQGGYIKERNRHRRDTFVFYLNMVLSALVSAIVAYIVSSLKTGGPKAY